MKIKRFWQALVVLIWICSSQVLADDTYQAFQNQKLKTNLDTALAHGLNYTFQFAEVDKQQHFVAGMLVGSSASVLAAEYFVGSRYAKLKASLVGMGSSILAGVLKEVHDAHYGGNVEVMDAVYTAVAGSLLSFRLNF